MSTFERVVGILRTTLQLGARANSLTPKTQLLGGIPEFDSMAVVTVLTALEDELGITVEDDELSAEVFGTVGTLTDFVEQKLRS